MVHLQKVQTHGDDYKSIKSTYYVYQAHISVDRELVLLVAQNRLVELRVAELVRFPQ